MNPPNKHIYPTPAGSQSVVFPDLPNKQKVAPAGLPDKQISLAGNLTVASTDLPHKQKVAPTGLPHKQSGKTAPTGCGPATQADCTGETDNRNTETY